MNTKTDNDPAGKPGKPKTRKIWRINPKTRVKESGKTYDRAGQKTDDRRAIDDVINFFGD